MRTLFLSARQFWPLDTGGKLRDYHLARGLARHSAVTYLGFADSAHSAPCPDDLAAPFARVEMIHRPAGRSAADLVRGLTGPLPATVLAYTTGQMRARLASLVTATRFDTIQVEGVHLGGYMDILAAARGAPPIVSDWHNVESELMGRFAGQAPNPAIRFYARATAHKLAALEQRQRAGCAAILVPSRREADAIERSAPGKRPHVVENGVAVADYAAVAAGRRADEKAPTSLIFVGSMDYHANIDAAVWFVSTIWPHVHARNPDLTFAIVGRNPPAAVRRLAEVAGVAVTGGVADVRPYYRDALAALVPLRVGGGTRLKILESMAAGTPVISTALGAEGLDAAAGRDFLAAEGAGGFCAAIEALRGDRALGLTIAARASALVASTYDWTAIGDQLAALHTGLARREMAA